MTAPEDQIKIAYITLSGLVSTAYVSAATMCGIDKYTDQPVTILWDDGLQNYYEKETPHDRP